MYLFAENKQIRSVNIIRQEEKSGFLGTVQQVEPHVRLGSNVYVISCLVWSPASSRVLITLPHQRTPVKTLHSTASARLGRHVDTEMCTVTGTVESLKLAGGHCPQYRSLPTWGKGVLNIAATTRITLCVPPCRDKMSLRWF